MSDGDALCYYCRKVTLRSDEAGVIQTEAGVYPVCKACSAARRQTTPQIAPTDALQGGRALDEAIARVVFGQTNFAHPRFSYQEVTLEDGDGWSGFSCPRCGASEGDTTPCVKRYSESIEAAWQVVERMQGQGYRFTITSPVPSLADSEWWVRINKPPILSRLSSAFEKTAPLAICRAALAALRADAERE